jgi:ABC-type branched-subunit amino acid transport system ATPase component
LSDYLKVFSIICKGNIIRSKGRWTLSETGTDTILKVEGLKKGFGGVLAVDGVGFDIRRGELLGVIGPNGSGKTTLVNLLTGFVKPDSGKVFYEGNNIAGKQPYRIAALGMVRTFQMVKPFYQLPAFKNLIIPLYSSRVKKLRGGKYGERDDVAIDILEDVGFERDSFVPYKVASVLPHGYLKRLELARCIALRPQLLILDELFSGMSMAEVASTLPIIQRLHEEGLSIIMVEHRLRELFRVASRIMVLNFGRKIAEGLPREVMEKEEVKGAYLGSEAEE